MCGMVIRASDACSDQRVVTVMRFSFGESRAAIGKDRNGKGRIGCAPFAMHMRISRQFECDAIALRQGQRPAIDRQMDQRCGGLPI